MTEEDMKTKVCPKLSVSIFDSYKLGEKLIKVNCLGSDCAMWVSDGVDKPKHPTKFQKETGHCGLIK